MKTFEILIGIPFVIAGIAALLRIFPDWRTAVRPSWVVWGFTAAMGAAFAGYLGYLPVVTEQGAQISTVEWVPGLGLALSFYLDGLSLLFALIVTGIGALVTLYAGHYFEDDAETYRFYALLLAFSGAMLALVLAGNVLTLFIAWEGTSILSFLLIGFKGSKEAAARIGAMRALVITGGGGLALIAGLAVLGGAAGSFELADILTNDTLRTHPWYTGFTLLIMLGCFTKSAQFPFHFWLPGAMSAPSPASAYLHSATMVKAGLYLLARFNPVLGSTDLWLHGLMGIGLVTMALGAFFALRQRDLKALLAYSTVSKLGALVALIGMPEQVGMKAVLVGIVAHALYKGTLFLLAGVIEHATGTRLLDQLGDLRSRLPGTALIAVLAGLSMAGYPPLLGWVAKETLLDAALPHSGLTYLPIIIVTAASILTVVAALLYVWEVFFRPLPSNAYDSTHFHAPPLGLLLGPGVMAGLSLLIGLTLSPILDPLLTPALGKDPHLHLFPEDGFANQAFQLSLLVLVVGPLIFFARRLWLALPELPLPKGAAVYDGLMGGLDRLGDLLLKVQGGRLRIYLTLILLSAALFIVSAQLITGNLVDFGTIDLSLRNPGPDLLKLVLLVLALGAMLASIILYKHLLAALALGVSGYAIGGIFLLEPAPDVALVQVLVETLGTVLVIIMIARVPVKQRLEMIERSRSGSRSRYLRDGLLAALVGTIVGAFALSAVTNRPETFLINVPIAQWHLQNSYDKLEVTDAVAGIVTDFRGMDTLIEITVFSLAALGLLTLFTQPESSQLIRGKSITSVRESLKIRPNPNKVPVDSDLTELEAMQSARAASRMSTPLTRFVAKIMLPFALLVAVSHILYGGSGPGDGFTAGVIGGLAVALWYVVFGYFEARQRLNWLMPGRILVIGLAIAFGNAAVPVLFGDAFLEIQKFGDAPADLHLTSTLIYELGIFMTVFGSASLIMEAIAHPREVEGL